MVNNPESLAKLSVHELVELAGSQGVELMMWLAMRGALGESVTAVTSNYHVPISNTAAGLLVAVPAVMLYNNFVRRMGNMLTVAENHARTLRIESNANRNASRPVSRAA